MDLRSALLLAGIVVIVLVAVTTLGRGRWRAWLERWRAEPREAPASPSGGMRAVAIADESPDTGSPAVPEAIVADPQEQPPVAAPVERDPGEFHRLFGDDASAGQPHAELDFVIHLPLGETVSRSEVLAIYRQREYDLIRPHAVYGRAGEDGEWSDVERDRDDHHYDELALAIQLADARGAATDTELNILSSIALELADAYGGRTLFLEDIDRALERAAALEHFFGAHDLIASIHVLANSPEGFMGRAIDQAAHRIGMQYGARSIYHHVEDGPPARTLFSLADLCQPGEFDLGRIGELRTPGVTLFLAVPVVRDPGDAFARMAGAATTLARVLDGRMLDSDRRTLTPEGLARIRGQIDRIAAAMREAGIPPGSDAARRLFGDPARSEA